jgi:serine/threonine-protein kinase RsbW
LIANAWSKQLTASNETGRMRWIYRSLPDAVADRVLELEVWVKSSVDQVSRVVDEVMGFIKRSGEFSGDLFDVELALREAVNNAVIHGNRFDPTKMVRVMCRCSLPEGISFIVQDEGGGFAPNQVRNPLAVENLGLSHGRGIHLMKLLMDEVHFEHRGTEVHLRKYSVPHCKKGQEYSGSAISYMRRTKD